MQNPCEKDNKERRYVITHYARHVRPLATVSVLQMASRGHHRSAKENHISKDSQSEKLT